MVFHTVSDRFSLKSIPVLNYVSSARTSLVSAEEKEERLERRHALRRERASRESAEEREEHLTWKIGDLFFTLYAILLVDLQLL